MADASLVTYLSFYFAGVLTLLVVMALRDTNQMRATLIVLLLWPLVLLVASFIWLRDRLEQRGWYVAINHQPDLSRFGLRRRVGGVGWAVRCLGLELQVWKHRQELRP